MVVGIYHPKYLPNTTFFSRLYHVDAMVLLDNSQFPDRNRLCYYNRSKIRINSIKKVQMLTVPVIRRPRGQKFKCVQIDHSNLKWKRTHLKSIQRNYSKAKYLINYFNSINNILMKDWKLLINLNMEMINWHLDVLGIDHKKIILESSLGMVNTNGVNKIINICQLIGGNVYLSGPHEFIRLSDFDKDKFNNNHIALKGTILSNVEYPQCFKPFIPNVAALDLLLNVGPDSEIILKKLIEIRE
jgi:hypothetical protein